MTEIFICLQGSGYLLHVVNIRRVDVVGSLKTIQRFLYLPFPPQYQAYQIIRVLVVPVRSFQLLIDQNFTRLVLVSRVMPMQQPIVILYRRYFRS